jgi:hypothetical protein
MVINLNASYGGSMRHDSAFELHFDMDTVLEDSLTFTLYNDSDNIHVVAMSETCEGTESPKCAHSTVGVSM